MIDRPHTTGPIAKPFKGYVVSVEPRAEGFIYIVKKRNAQGVERIYWGPPCATRKKARAEATRFITRMLCTPRKTERTP